MAAKEVFPSPACYVSNIGANYQLTPVCALGIKARHARRTTTSTS